MYRLEITDGEGDGWEASYLVVNNGFTSDTVALDGINDNGTDSIVYLPVYHNTQLSLFWKAVSFNGIVTIKLYDVDNILLYSGQNPVTGILYNGPAVCPPCVPVAAFKVDDVWDNRARIRWTPASGSSQPVGWRVYFGPKGFNPALGEGDSVYISTPKVTLTNLAKNSEYEVYIRQDCDSGIFSELTGPLGFKTYLTNDIGIANLINPATGCELEKEKITFQLANYGSNPQSLVLYDYSVNGLISGVTPPDDGLYTDVLGKDSLEIISFDTPFDFSAPGEYQVKIWTKLPNDENPENDTATFYVANRYFLPYSQSFETWGGGWAVDDDTASILPSWVLGTPDKVNLYSAASGKNAWTTNLKGSGNLGERSYLISPCFDFSNALVAPLIEFDLYYRNSTFSEYGWLEASINDGLSWSKVGAIEEGLNWYNLTIPGAGDNWSGATQGWVKAQNRLFGLQGQSHVRLRFAYQNADFQGFLTGGFAIDNVSIYIPANNDLAAVSAYTTGQDDPCGSSNDQIRFKIRNNGINAQANFSVSYSINNQPAVTELVPNVVLTPFEEYTYSFKTPFDSRDKAYTIKVWSSLSGEAFPANDTVYLFVDHRKRELPVLENFEDKNLPGGWFTNSNAFITNAHGNTSYVLASNLSFDFDSLIYISYPLGPIGANDKLHFDYRISEAPLGVNPASLFFESKVLVQVSVNCSPTFSTVYTINSLTYVKTAGLQPVEIDLSKFAGKDIVVRFLGNILFENIWFDLDNISISKGSIATKEPVALPVLNLYPNPASDQIRVDIELPQSSEVKLDLVDMLGQSVHQLILPPSSRFRERIDIRQQPAGLYILRCTANGQTVSKKVLKME